MEISKIFNSYLTFTAFRREVLSKCDISTWNCPFAVTLTMHQRMEGPTTSFGYRQSIKLDEGKASDNVRHFLNRLNRRVYGHASERYGKKVRVIPVIEHDELTHLHVHAAIDCPPHVEPSEFAELIRSNWLATHWGRPGMDIRPNANSGWITYILKARTKTEYDTSIDWANFHND